jgi:hypothetical protein
MLALKVQALAIEGESTVQVEEDIIIIIRGGNPFSGGLNKKMKEQLLVAEDNT